jgi:hypothetical protein
MAWTRAATASAELAGLATLKQALGTGLVAPTVSTSQKRTGDYAYRFQATSDAIGVQFDNAGHVRMGAWVYIATLPGVGARGNLVMTWLDYANGLFWALAVDSAGDLIHYVRDDDGVTVDYTTIGTIAAASTGLTVGAWHHIGLHLRYDRTATEGDPIHYHAVRLWVDGDPIVDDEVGTLTTDTWSALYFGGGHPVAESGGWADAYFDDVYIDLGSGEAATEAPSQKRFLLRLPTGVGGRDEWDAWGDTSKSVAVSERPPDNDTTGVYTQTTNKRQTYAAGTVAAINGYIPVSVVPFAIARKAEGGLDAQLRVLGNIEPAQSQSAAVAVTTAYLEYQHYMPTQPDGNTWSLDTVNILAPGVKAAGTMT